MKVLDALVMALAHIAGYLLLMIIYGIILPIVWCWDMTDMLLRDLLGVPQR